MAVVVPASRQRSEYPTLGRLDSGVAPLSRLRRFTPIAGCLERGHGCVRSSAQVRSRPPESGKNYRAPIAHLASTPGVSGVGVAYLQPPPLNFGVQVIQRLS